MNSFVPLAAPADGCRRKRAGCLDLLGGTVGKGRATAVLEQAIWDQGVSARGQGVFLIKSAAYRSRLLERESAPVVGSAARTGLEGLEFLPLGRAQRTPSPRARLHFAIADEHRTEGTMPAPEAWTDPGSTARG